MTHDSEEALILSDKVLILRNEKVEQFGMCDEIIHAPASKFVEEFILQQLQIKRNNIYYLFEPGVLR